MLWLLEYEVQNRLLVRKTNCQHRLQSKSPEKSMPVQTINRENHFHFWHSCLMAHQLNSADIFHLLYFSESWIYDACIYDAMMHIPMTHVSQLEILKSSRDILGLTSPPTSRFPSDLEMCHELSPWDYSPLGSVWMKSVKHALQIESFNFCFNKPCWYLS